ncbi:ANTAR domain-containing protein [Geodermatophilus sp. URMC 64]
MSSDSRPASTGGAAALERLGRLALREQSMESLLQAVADSARTVMPGTPEASISVLAPGRAAATVAFTGQLAMDLDEAQYSEGYGPCLHAAATHELTEIVDTRTEERWPDYARRAAERGNLSSLSVPLIIDETTSGALNIYAREADAFDDAGRAAATGFAPYAAVAIANMQDYQSTRDLAGNLQAALDSRAVNDQAKGILMERHKVTADQAFRLLAHASMTTNTKVRDVADHLVRTGELRGQKR